MKNTLVLGLASAVVFGSGVSAMAQPASQYTTVYGAPVPYSPYAPGARGPSAQQWEQYQYDQSGTLGRQGLGADPRHPEGPGNASSPR